MSGEESAARRVVRGRSRCRGCNGPFPRWVPRDRLCDDCRTRCATHDPRAVVPWRKLTEITLAVPLVLGGLLIVLLALATFPHWLMVTFELGPAAFLLYIGVFAIGSRIGRAMERLGFR